MRYDKPEVLLLGRTIETVKAMTKGGDELDSLDATYSPPAYEVDE